MDLLRRAFRDIAAGHTRATILGRPAFIRHLCYADQCDFDQKRDEFYAEARSLEVKTDEERLIELKQSGEWSDEKELDITRLRQHATSLEEGKRKAKHPSMIRSLAAQIEQAKKDYDEKAAAKRQLIGLTCEVHADREVNDYYIAANIFADPNLSQPFFQANEFVYLTDEAMGNIVGDYNRSMEACSEQGIKRLAMQAFFQRYFQLAGDDYTTFFGKPICALTFYQVDLLRYGAHFRNIYANHDVSQFPANVMADPDLLTDYANAAAKGKEELAKQGANEEGAVVIGLKKEDRQAMGLKGGNPMRQIQEQFGGNVLEWAAKKG